VVDFHDPESQPEALHPRFDARVFSAGEREALGASGSPHSLRWSFWAAKESAYKVAKKLDAAVRFMPRDFLVRPVAEGWALVLHETRSFEVRLERTDEWVHAVATLAAAKGLSTHRSVSVGIEPLEASSTDASRTVRESALAALSSRMSLPTGQIRIAAERGIPVAVWRKRRLPVDLSLSHHGRFVAWAWGECAVPEGRRGFVAA
jgi:phosphopantetheinyl transferase (holo-ACP synthase)